MPAFTISHNGLKLGYVLVDTDLFNMKDLRTDILLIYYVSVCVCLIYVFKLPWARSMGLAIVITHHPESAVHGDRGLSETNGPISK